MKNEKKSELKNVIMFSMNKFQTASKEKMKLIIITEKSMLLLNYG